jgi:glycosyltransferase involved in cell wall biosynthesis
MLRLTIAICSWNRCDLLRQTLAGLCEATCPSDVALDVLVVNNASTDDTSAVVRTFEGQLPIREVLELRPGLSNARNRALHELPAGTHYLIWIDDDVLVAPGWLTALVDAARRAPDAAGFGGPIDPWFVVNPDPVLASAFPVLAGGFCGLNHGDRERLLTADEPIYGANMAYAVAAISGLTFDPALGTSQGSGMASEEVVFQEAIRARGGTFLWVPGMHVRHYVDPARMTLAYLTRFAYDRGRTFMRTHSHAAPRVFGVPRWVWRGFVVAIARHALLRFSPFRRAALTSLREYQFSRGMIDEARAAARARRAPREAGSCA